MNKDVTKNVLIAAISLYIAFTSAYYAILWINDQQPVMGALGFVCTAVFVIFFFNALSDVEHKLRKKT